MDITFHPLGTETSNGASDPWQQPGLVLVGLFVNVTDAEGTLPSLTVTLQQSVDGATWYNVGNIAVTRSTAGASASTPAALGLVADYTRVYWSITGASPSFTFSADVAFH